MVGGGEGEGRVLELTLQLQTGLPRAVYTYYSENCQRGRREGSMVSPGEDW